MSDVSDVSLVSLVSLPVSMDSSVAGSEDLSPQANIDSTRKIIAHLLIDNDFQFHFSLIENDYQLEKADFL